MKTSFRTTRRTSRRRGAALVEGAFVSLVLLFILFTTFDVGLAVIRQNALSDAARRLAREAIVRGRKAEATNSVWGPSTISVTASDATYAAELRPMLITMPPSDVSIQIEWPDGEVNLNDRVRVTVSYVHDPITPFLFGSSPLALSSTSTMRIAH